MVKKMNWVKFGQSLRRRSITLFSPLEVQRQLRLSPSAVSALLHDYTRQGALVKLRNGLYCFADARPSELAIANRLYEPSYISFEYALAYYHVIPETVYTITSATSRPTRTFTVTGTRFEYHLLKRPAFTGYDPLKINGDTILIAAPEKALVDYLYFVDLKKASLNERLRLQSLTWSRVEAYMKLFGRASLRKLVKRLR